MACRTLRSVSEFTPVRPFNTRSTVAVPTPALRAISAMVTLVDMAGFTEMKGLWYFNH
jgi:hypothetical protein